MTRSEAEDLAREDAENGTYREVPAAAEGWYECARAEAVDNILRARRRDLRHRGIVVPWWEVYP